MTTPEMEGAVRRRRVPKKLVGKPQKEILEWARGELNGEEPDLKSADLRRISKGEISEVVLRPKKKGFFLPDGTFVEAFDYSPEIGEDLEKAEELWDEEERLRDWVDEENRRFNKAAVEGSKHPLRLMWEHGMRTEEFARKSGTPVFKLQNMLVERGGAESYSLQSHQFCTDFYNWLPSAMETDRVFSFSWELVDSILRFSRNKDIRTHVLEQILSNLIEHLSERQVIRLLGTKGPGYYVEDRDLDDEDRQAIGEIRNQLREMKRFDTRVAVFICKILRK